MLRSLFRKFSVATKTKTTESASGVITRAKDFKFSKDKDIGMNEESTPKMINEYLDKHVVGQTDAKKALSIAYSKILC